MKTEQRQRQAARKALDNIMHKLAAWGRQHHAFDAEGLVVGMVEPLMEFAPTLADSDRDPPKVDSPVFVIDAQCHGCQTKVMRRGHPSFAVRVEVVPVDRQGRIHRAGGKSYAKLITVCDDCIDHVLPSASVALGSMVRLIQVAATEADKQRPPDKCGQCGREVGKCLHTFGNPPGVADELINPPPLEYPRRFED